MRRVPWLASLLANWFPRRQARQLRQPGPRPRLESLEDRSLPSLTPAAVAFNSATGWLSISGGPAGAPVQLTANQDALTVSVNGQGFSPAGSAARLRHIQVGGGDALTVAGLSTSGDLAIQSNGAVTLAGPLHVAGRLSLDAAALTVTGSTSAAGLSLHSAGLLDVEAHGSLTARAGGTLTASAGDFVNVGLVRADGSQGGHVAVTARDYLNGGTVSAAGSMGAGGVVSVAYSQSYIDTSAASTSVRGTTGGQVSISGRNGRLFSSGHFSATGSSGGQIDLFGRNVVLVAATVDASGTAGKGGGVRIGGDYQGLNPTAPDAQTTQVSARTTIQASAGGVGAGGRVIVWSQESTVLGGSISAAGAGGGAGGFVEVSSHGSLSNSGKVNVGAGGTLRLDPQDLVINEATGVFPQFTLVNPGTGGAFGTQVLTLSTGNVLVTDPQANNSAGAVYLFNGTTGALLATLTGSSSGDGVGANTSGGGIILLPGGGYLVSSPGWNGNRGAVTWGSGTKGVTGAVSAGISLVGSSGGDRVGSNVTLLNNGNYVVDSPNWNNNEGAVTWGSGTKGVSGILSSGNSLIGSTPQFVDNNGMFHSGDLVGNFGVTALSNGNYVVDSPNWDNLLGAVTWGNGSTGTSGVVSSSNSLIGSSAAFQQDQNFYPGDQVGSSGVTALSNGNYVVASPHWNSDRGAATWGNGTTGIHGFINAADSLIGSPSDLVGLSVVALSNGNYVVDSPHWNFLEGAVTWANGTTGLSGTVSAAGSLTGSAAGDLVGSTVTALNNGNYVVAAPNWSGGVGAATWASGSAALSATISASNSLVGSLIGDQVGSGITTLTNGNYVVASPSWSGGLGAATWGSGTAGVTGVVSPSNSLVGSASSDTVGSLILPLSNGAYVVDTPSWGSGLGAVSWGSGTGGVKGTVSAANSLVGSLFGDQVGSTVTLLKNGNYVVISPSWSNQSGAVTWASQASGIVGTVSASNSLVGTNATFVDSNNVSHPGDQVGSRGVTALSNGNYVVDSPQWNSSTGAATWGDGTAGTSGAVSAKNSLVGTNPSFVDSNNVPHPGDQVGSLGVTALSNGNYVVDSPQWNSGDGAATWGNGTTGTKGTIAVGNSLLSFVTGTMVGNGGVTALSNGNYVVNTPNWNNATGAATWVDGADGTTLDSQNTIDVQNSVAGAAGSAGLGSTRQGIVPGSFLTPFPGSGGNIVIGVPDPNQLTAGVAPTRAMTITPDFLTRSLDTGTAVDLQADNSVTVGSPIIVSAGGHGGNLTLEDTSLLLDADISTDGGALTLSGSVAPAGPSTGVVQLTASSVSFEPGSSLAVQLLGTTPGTQYDQVRVRGPIDLSNVNLNVSGSSGLTADQNFVIVQSTQPITTHFAGLPEGSFFNAGGQTYGISYGFDRVTLTTVPAGFSFSPATLSNAQVGVFYRQQLAVSGGTAPYSFAPGSGTLPPGMSISSDGVLSGVPTATGLFTFSIAATDSTPTPGPFTRTQSYSLLVTTISLSDTIFPIARVGARVNQQLSVTGGIGPYTYKVASGRLPPGLSLTGSGALVGIPRAAGSYAFIVDATDSSPSPGPFTGARAYTVQVTTTTLGALPTSVVAGAGYRHPIPVSGGTGPYTFKALGTLPGGLTLSTTGVVSGTPVRAGTFSFVIQAKDSNGVVGTRIYSLTVLPARAAKVTFLTQPAAVHAVNQFLSPFAVQVLDRFGNAVHTPVTLTLVIVKPGKNAGFGPGSVTQVTPVNGVAAFRKVSVSAKGTYRLIAHDGLVTAESNPFTVG